MQATMPAFDLLLHTWRFAPHIGDDVRVLEYKDRKFAVQGRVLSSASGRYFVQCGNATVSVPERRVFPAYGTLCNGRPLVVAVPDTESLRRLVRTQIDANDAVVDVGCSYGACSVTHCRSFVGIDISHECVTHCCQAFPELRFERLDALGDRASLHRLLVRERPSVIIVDIAGVRPLPDVMEMLEALVEMMAEIGGAQDTPLRILLKSESLVAAADAALEAGIATTRPLKPPLDAAPTAQVPIDTGRGVPSPTSPTHAIGFKLTIHSAGSVRATIVVGAAAGDSWRGGDGSGHGDGDAVGSGSSSGCGGGDAQLRAIPCGEDPGGWWSLTLASGLARRKSAGRDTRLHLPNWYPQKLAPGSTIFICRFHNYSRCQMASGGAGCAFDHRYCHFCLGAGHVATTCADFLATLAPSA